MVFLMLAVGAFVAVHLIPAVPALKQPLQARLGTAWGPAFGTASIVLLVAVVFAWRAAEFTPVYEPPAWGWMVTFGFVLVAFLCLGVFSFRGKLRQRLRFPLAIGVIFWAAGHLFANGDMASIILFGGFLVYAVAHLALGLSANVRPDPQVRGGHDVISLLAGVALYGVMIQMHGTVIGKPVFELLGG